MNKYLILKDTFKEKESGLNQIITTIVGIANTEEEGKFCAEQMVQEDIKKQVMVEVGGKTFPKYSVRYVPETSDSSVLIDEHRKEL
jgi:hypothetical protein